MVPDNAGKPIDTAAHTDDMPAEETIETVAVALASGYVAGAQLAGTL